MPPRHSESTIKRILNASGHRYDWFARQVGLTPPEFTHIEAGRREPPDGYYERAAEVLGVPIDMIRPEPDDEDAA